MNPEQVHLKLCEAGPGTTVFFVGIGGCGMSGLAHMLLDLGHTVAGSDLKLSEETLMLSERNATLFEGHEASRLISSKPILVVYSSAIPSDNPELAAAAQLKIPIVRRATLLAALARSQSAICVAGMHGKTTTASMLGFVLRRLKANTSYAIGATVPQLPRCAFYSKETSARESSGDRVWFVAETDESDGTLCEFEPEYSIVLNIDREHLDYYADLEAIKSEFRKFASQTRRKTVFCADDTELANQFGGDQSSLSYGFNPLADYRIQAFPPDPHRVGISQFGLWHRGDLLGEFAIKLVGRENISNAAAVVALLHELGYPIPEIRAALADFQGARRRQEELYSDSRYRVFDDYGHHPTEIRSTIAAIRELNPRRLLVAFQPHRYTRTEHLKAEFSTCFRGADQLWLAEIYAAHEEPLPGVSGRALAGSIKDSGQDVRFVSDLPSLRNAIREALQPGDIVLFLGAGEITNAAKQLAALLREEPRSNPDEFVGALSEALSSEAVLKRQEPLAKRTTLRVGGPAEVFVEPASEDDLKTVLQICGRYRQPFFFLGRGSNLLIRDGGIRGAVISFANRVFSQIRVEGDRLICGAGARLKQLAVEARRQGLTGFEFLEGIPGSVGGALRMNAGAMGSWMFEVVESLRFMNFDGAVCERSASEIYVEYRGCPLFKNHIALEAVLKGSPATTAAVKKRMDTFSARRWETQPAASSAGCIFKNPEATAAGRLIEELGLKGTRVGNAVVSEVHGNFIVNEGGATAKDVLSLIATIQQQARSARGIDLQTEVQIVGE